VRVRKAVIPVAGMGTRMLPATKAIPKELVCVVDRPSVQWVVEAARDSGIEQVIFVTSSGKSAIEDHFDRQPCLERLLELKGRADLVALVRDVSRGLSILSVRQPEPLGLGHAVLMAREAVGDEPFAVILPDELVAGPRPALAQCVEIANRAASPVIGLVRVPREHASRYGMVDADERDDGTVVIHDLVEKPDPADSPSDLAISGPYVLVPEVFDVLESSTPGRVGEIQLTDALRALTDGERPLLGCLIEGERLDVGQPLGFLQANVAYGLAHPELGAPLRAWLKRRLSEDD
jgi:UTP--glucose-1-phosphate uridylyltransferase